MRFYRLLVVVMVVLVGFVVTVPAHSYYRGKPSEVSSKPKEDRKRSSYESVQLIKGDPGKPFIRVGFVWETHRKAEKAIKRLKKNAHKMGADAVIHYVVQAPTVFGWVVRWSTPEEAQQAKAAEEIPLYLGKPKRSYQELGPVWISHRKINTGLKKLKKLAKKKKADAIAEFTIGNYKGTAQMSYMGANGTMVFQPYNYLAPTLQGVAVKWSR